jgi:hypothetical protein
MNHADGVNSSDGGDIRESEFKVFYGYQFQSEHFDPEVLRETLEAACKQAQELLEPKVRIVAVGPETSLGGILPVDLLRMIEASAMCIFEISDSNPNVLFEVGYTMGREKRMVLLANGDVQVPTDLQSVTRLPYARTNPKKLVPKLAKTIAEGVADFIESRPLAQWFWERLGRSAANVFLGRTTEENFSWGDVVAMDMLRKNLKKQEMLELNLNSEVKGDVLEQQVISIGGPRRNKITESILALIGNRSYCRFVDIKNLEESGLGEEDKSDIREKMRSWPEGLQPDPYVIYDTGSRKLRTTTLDFTAADKASSEEEKRRLTTGTDYGLVYRVSNPALEEATWMVFAGISRAGTLACLEAMLRPETLRKVRRKLESSKQDIRGDLEILLKTRIVNGRGIGAIPISETCRTLDPPREEEDDPPPQVPARPRRTSPSRKTRRRRS